RRTASIGPFMNLFVIDAFHLPPELKPAVARMVADKIDGNPDEPGIDAAFSAKCVAMPVGLPETLLPHPFTPIHIAHGCEQESKDSRPILLDEPLEVFDLQRGILHTDRNESRCRRCLHIRIDEGFHGELNTALLLVTILL